MQRCLPLSLLFIALAGCTLGPDFVRPEVAADAGYSTHNLTTSRPPPGPISTLAALRNA